MVAIFACLILSVTLLHVVCAFKVVRFSGGGIFFFWQLGAASYIHQHCQSLHNVPVMGASAGSIAATLMATQVSFEEAASVAIRIASEHNVWQSKTGLAGIWGSLIRKFLEEIIPDDLSEETLSKINILVTPRFFLKGPKLLSRFDSKADLIEAIMASVHIPLFMNGKVTTTYKEEKYMDGSFWSMVANIKGPWPVDQIDKRRDVLHIDYNHDKDFISENGSTAITKAISPDDVHEMMKRGYEYMQKQAEDGKLLVA